MAIPAFRTPIRDAWRTIRRDRVTVITAALTLGLGLGGAVTLYSTFRATLLASPSIPRPEEIVRIVAFEPTVPDGQRLYPTSSVGEWRRGLSSDIVAVRGERLLVRDALGVTTRGVQFVSDGFDRVVGFAPMAGVSVFRVGPPSRAVVVSARFASERSLHVGDSIEIEGSNYAVSGIMADGLSFPSRPQPDVWARLEWNDRNTSVQVFARVASERQRIQLEAELSSIARAQGNERRLRAIPLSEDSIRRAGLSAGLVLAPGIVFLLIACVNVIHLLLAHTVDARRGLALRAALGANAAQLSVTPALMGATVAVSAGLVGWLFTSGGIAFVRRVVVQANPDIAESVAIAPGAPVFGAMCLVAAWLLCVLPVLRYVRRLDLTQLLSLGHQRIRSVALPRWTDVLLVSQVALSTALILVSALVTGVFQTYASEAVSFDVTNVAVADVRLPAVPAERVLGAVTSDSGMPLGMALSDSLPSFGRAGRVDATFTVHNLSSSVPARVPVKECKVSADYFRVLGLRILAGRAMRAGEQGAAVISRSLAMALFHHQNVVGEQMRVDDGSRLRQVELVGVADDYTRVTTDPNNVNVLFEPLVTAPQVYLLAQFPTRQALDRAIAGTGLKSSDRQIALADVRDLETELERPLVNGRVLAQLLRLFGVAGLILAGAGIHAMAKRSVSERMRELGIRVALGASVRSIVATSLGRAALLLSGGVALGIGTTVVVSSLVWWQMVASSIDRADTWLSVSIPIMIIGLVAAAQPAARAIHVHPSQLLREE